MTADIGAVLDAIRRRAEAATDGPWVTSVHGCGCVLSSLTGDYVAMHGDDSYGQSETDAEFIAHAREDVPRLLAAVDAVLGLCDEWECMPEGDDDHRPYCPVCHRVTRIRAAITEALTRKEEA